MNISPDIYILTQAELNAKLDKAFKRGVERGKFEAGNTHHPVARNCGHWINGICDTCGSQTQHNEVDPDFKCPAWVERRP